MFYYLLGIEINIVQQKFGYTMTIHEKNLEAKGKLNWGMDPRVNESINQQISSSTR